MSFFQDPDLIACVLLNGDRNAYGELVRRHGAAVRILLRKLTGGDHSKADDLAQETFIKGFRKLSSYRGEAGFRSWLYRIATNLFLSEVRKGKRRREMAQGQPSENLPVGDAVGQRRVALHLDLERAMSTLEERERAALCLCYFGGLSRKETAEILGCPEGTVKTRILRAKGKLRGRLAPWRSKG